MVPGMVLMKLHHLHMMTDTYIAMTLLKFRDYIRKLFKPINDTNEQMIKAKETINALLKETLSGPSLSKAFLKV